MASLAATPAIERPSFGLAKRLSSFTYKSPSPSDEVVTRGHIVLYPLPPVDQLDDNDFADLFSDPGAMSTSSEYSPLTLAAPFQPAPMTTLPASYSSEQNNSSHIRFGSSYTVRRKAVPLGKQAEGLSRTNDTATVSYRASVSSSNPSTRKSNASSTFTRESSLSSVTDDVSSSERSSKDSGNEEALIQQRRARFRDKRISHGHTSMRPISSLEPCAKSPGRGKRLGKAMAEGVPASPPTPAFFLNQSLFGTPLSIPDTPEPVSDLHLPFQASKPTLHTRRSTSPVLGGGVDRVRVGIMAQLDNIRDLASCAMISKGFYQTFVKHEKRLVENVLYRQSPAAWELRQSVRKFDKSNPYKLKPAMRDYATINALQDFIVWRCESILRPQSLEALLRTSCVRKHELENALWQIWMFCNIFGKASTSDASLLHQCHWLEGKHKPSARKSMSERVARLPCTMKELEDMSEMWRCLELLLSGFKNREQEARKVGILETADRSGLSDCDLLNLWIADILSLGPKAVLTLSSCNFEEAHVLGITKWTPPTKPDGRTKFLKAAVEEVYRDRLVREARQRALNYRKSVQHNHKRSRSDPSAYKPLPVESASSVPVLQQPPVLHTHVLDRQSMPPLPAPRTDYMNEIRPDCDPLSPAALREGRAISSTPTLNPGIFSPLVMTRNVSAKLGSTLFPIQNRDQSRRLSIPLTSAQVAQNQEFRCSGEYVVDPSDSALTLMVQDMGFSHAESRRALMLSDTGSGIDVQKAIDLLSSSGTTIVYSKKTTVSELPASTGDARLSQKSGPKELSESDRKPEKVVEPKRERLSGLGIMKRGLSYKMSFRKSMKLSVIPDEDENPLPTTEVIDRPRTTSSLRHSSTVAYPKDDAYPSPPVLPPPSPPSSKDVIHPRHDTPDVPAVSAEQLDIHHWLQDEFSPISDTEARLESINQSFDLQAQPRFALQRVGTGVTKPSWSLPGRKRKEQVIKPEIIGYVY